MKGIEEIFNNIWDRREFADYLSRNEFTMLQEKVQTKIKDLESEVKGLNKDKKFYKTLVSELKERVNSLEFTLKMIVKRLSKELGGKYNSFIDKANQLLKQ